MEAPNGRTRRALMATLTSLPLVDAVHGSSAAEGRSTRADPSILVAYLSRTGNTRVVAGLIQRATAADVFEIRSAEPYPDEYLATVEQARKERDLGIEPALAETLANMARYDTIYLGFPIWGETAPPLIRSFLAKHDLTGKTLLPFITHGGYGLGNSESVLRQHAPKAVLTASFSMQADQERQTMNRVNDWMRTTPARRS